MLVTADEIYEAIAARFAPPEWACFSEVADSTGYARRRADAIAFNLWPSRGLEIRGFEIKTSRTDLMHELKKVPEKAENLAQFCDTWWLVCPKEILATVDIDIVPLAWGVLAYHPNTKTKLLRMVKEAQKNDDPTPVDRAFLASVLRHADAHVRAVTGRYVHRDAIDDRLKAEYQRGVEGAAREKDRTIKDLTDKAAAVDVFVEAFGLGAEFEERSWRCKEEVAKEAVEMMAVGRAVMGKYGQQPRNIISAGEELIEFGKRIRDVGKTLDVGADKEKP